MVIWNIKLINIERIWNKCDQSTCHTYAKHNILITYIGYLPLFINSKGNLGRAKTSRASRTQSQARLNSAEAQPRTVGHNRKRRRWFSRKYYASVMRIKEFYEDNIGKTFTGILSNALNKNFGR